MSEPTAPVMTKGELLQRLDRQVPEIRDLGVRALGVFGSFRRDTPSDDSDVDLLVVFEEGRKTYASFLAVAALLESVLGRHVELVTPESLSPYIGRRILDEVQYVPIGG